METFGILFLHHHDSPVVLNNLRSVQRANPDALVVTMSAGQPLPRGYSLDATPALKERHSLNAKHSSDCLVCSWFMQRQEMCDKWWIVEWDTYCEISAREYYKPVWDLPFVSTRIALRDRDADWPWFSDIKDIPDLYKGHAMGAAPFLYLISDRALTAICETLISTPITGGNGEFRFGTAANKCGFPPHAFTPPNTRITWKNHLAPVKRGTISHPVKFHVYPAWRWDMTVMMTVYHRTKVIANRLRNLAE